MVKFLKENFGRIFIIVGILLQFVIACINHDSELSLVSGISGVIAVVLCSQRNVKFYLFAWIQTITYAYLALEQRLYGELIEYAFYALTMLYGMHVWLKHYNKENEEVISRSLSLDKAISVLSATGIGIAVVYLILASTDDTQPFLDSVTTVPAFTAQLLMILRYKEQWLYWLIIDIGSIIMWVNAGNYCLAAQFVFWTINCIYGYNLWKK